MKRIALIALAVLVAAVLVGFWYPFRGPGEMVLPGIVEIQEVRVGSKVGGRVASIEVEEGQRVSPGQRLVVFDVPELENQKEQLQAKLDAAEADYLRVKNGARVEEKDAARAAAEAAKARYDKMKEGWREEEKRAAASDLEFANAEWKLAKEDWDRIVELFRSKTASRAEYDAARGALDRARGRLNNAQSKVDMVNTGSRKEEIAEMKALWEQAAAKSRELDTGSRAEDVALAKARRDDAAAKLREVEINLREAVVSVPNRPEFKDALVEVVPIRAGDIVPANQPVIRLLCVKDLWVKTFVPATKMERIQMHEKVKVRIDTQVGRVFDGEVFYKAAISEFTPRNVQSVDERSYQVFAVKVRVADPDGVLNSGMAAEVTFPPPQK